MDTDQNNPTPADADTVQSEPEQQSDSLRPTEEAEDLEKQIVEEQAGSGM